MTTATATAARLHDSTHELVPAPHHRFTAPTLAAMRVLVVEDDPGMAVHEKRHSATPCLRDLGPSPRLCIRTSKDPPV